MENIHFSCTKCGQCCKTSPRVSFYDMIALSNEFIFQVGHQVRFSQQRQPLDKDVIEHYQKFSHTINVPEFDLSMLYHIDFFTLQFDSYQSCSKLKNNQCSIYHKRPVSCKISPLNYQYGEESQYKSVNFFKKMTDEKKFSCDFSKESPLLLSALNDKHYIYNNNTNDLFYNELSMHRDITDKYIDFLSFHGEDKKNRHFKTLYEHYSKNEMLITDVLFVLQMANHNHLLTQEKIKSFINDQLQLAYKECEISKSLKNKNNLKTYRMYQKIIQDYENILKEDNFNAYFSY